MKIIMDNEANVNRDIVCIKSKNNQEEIIDKDINTIIKALIAYGYDKELIKDAFLLKVIEWNLVKLPDNYANPDGYIDNKESYGYDDIGE